MKPESPTPFPIPEIIYDLQYPRTLLEYEFNSSALAELITAVRGERHSKLHRMFESRRIIIQGGLVKEPDLFGKPVYHSIPLNSEEGMSRLFDATYKPKVVGDWLAGGYSPVKREVFFYPDTLLLAQIANSAEADEKQTLDTADFVNTIKDDGRKRARDFLIEEIDHSFEPLALPALLFVPFRLIVERRAESKKSNLQLQKLAQQALTLQPLISDTQILDLFTIARNSYTQIEAPRPKRPWNPEYQHRKAYHDES